MCHFKSGRILLQTFYCSIACKAKDRDQHQLNMSRLVADLTPTPECSSGAQIVHTSWQGSDIEKVTEDGDLDLGVDSQITSEPRHNESSTSPVKSKPTRKKKVKPSEKPKKRKKDPRTHEEEPSAETLAAKARVKNAKALTMLFNKIRSKIGVLEPLTPTWSWVCTVDKNTANTRSSKHKYKSPPKLQDMTKSVATKRISRTWLDCMTLVEEIEKLDPAYRVTFEANKPENERNARLGKHKYETKDPNNPDPELDSEVSSQELSQGSESSRAPSVGTVNSENEVFVDCRVCKEPIVLDCVQEYIACTEPMAMSTLPPILCAWGSTLKVPVSASQ